MAEENLLDGIGGDDNGATPPEGTPPTGENGAGGEGGNPPNPGEGEGTGEGEGAGFAVKPPEWLPEKFWNTEKNEPNTEALAESYKQLERKLGERLPQVPEKYEVKVPEGMELSESDQQHLKDMGMTNEQAQKFVDFMASEIVPALTQQKVEVERANLQAMWRTDEGATLNRLKAVSEWANKSLPEGVVNELARTASGMNQLYQLMQSGAQVGVSGGQTTPSKTPEELQSMVADPRYTSDPAYRQEVERQFKLTYGE